MAALISVPSATNLTQINLGTLGTFPLELIFTFLKYLPVADVASLFLIRRSLAVLSENTSLWNLLFQRDFPEQNPNLTHPKKQYRLCSNIKNGRYTVEKKDFLPFERPLLMDRSLMYRAHADFSGKYLSLQSPKGLFFCIDFPENATVLRWNGTQLGCAGCDQEGYVLVLIKLDGKSQLQQVLRGEEIVNFSWQNKQLVTLSSGKLNENHHYDMIARIWDQNNKGKWQEKIKGHIASYLRRMPANEEGGREEVDSISDFAWNGHYLAITSGSPANLDLTILGRTKNRFQTHATLNCQASLIRWNGDLLITDDNAEASGGTVKVWDSRRNFECVQTLACPEYGNDYKKISDLMIRGNQLFTSVEIHCVANPSVYHTVTLWEQNNRGFYQQIQHIWQSCTKIPQKMTFNDNTLYIWHRLSYQSQQIKSLKFISTYTEIFEQLVEELLEVDHDLELNKTPLDIAQRNFDLIMDRFLRMPKGQKELIFKEWKKINPHFEKEWKSSELTKAIRNYLNNLEIPPQTPFPIG